MKYKNLNYLVFFIYLISSNGSYSIERPDVKNLIIHKEKKKIEKVEFFNSKNKKISLNDYKSNLVIINFWATWCAPCKEEMPHLNKLKHKLVFFLHTCFTVAKDDIGARSSRSLSQAEPSIRTTSGLSRDSIFRTSAPK